MLLGGTLLLAVGWGWRVLTREKCSIQRDPWVQSPPPASLHCRDPQRGSPERGAQEKAPTFTEPKAGSFLAVVQGGSQKVKRVGTQRHINNLVHSLRRDLCLLPSPTDPGTPLWNASLIPPLD